jgi:hypothetical protein
MGEGRVRSTCTDSLCVCDAFLSVTVSWETISELEGE